MPASGALAIVIGRRSSAAALNAATACAKEWTTMTGASVWGTAQAARMSLSALRGEREGTHCAAMGRPRGSPHPRLLEMLGHRQPLALIGGADRTAVKLLWPCDQRFVDHPADHLAMLDQERYLVRADFERSEERRVGKECRSRWS